MRTLVLWCPDWPIVAAGVPLDEPAAVLYANRVVACSPGARVAGIEVGLRRREAQGRCPSVRVLERDVPTEARRFEPVLAAVEAFTPRLEVTRPGACAVATRGPSRYFGGDVALGSQIVEAVDAVLADRTAVVGATEGASPARCRVGIADGPFAAAIAARHTRAGEPLRVVPPGETPSFLAPLPMTALERPELVEVLVRLGLSTLGDLAALPLGSVVGRFGSVGESAHRLASGLEERPPLLDSLPPDLMTSTEIDPPADRVDQVAFVAKALADDLHGRLCALGLACTRIAVEAETDHGERHERLWRHDGALSAAAIADRVRWQLEGWLQGPERARPTAGIVRLVLTPDEVRPATGRQLGFWGGESEVAERAARALARIEGLLGPDAVTVPEWRGGRGPFEQLALVPAGAVDLVARADAVAGARGFAALVESAPPWPGRVPTPSPAGVHHPPLPAEVLDVAGAAVAVDGRGLLSDPPRRVSVAAGRLLDVDAWAGPWPVDERWWDTTHRRRARLQVVTTAGTAHLFTLERGRWWCEATYD